MRKITSLMLMLLFAMTTWAQIKSGAIYSIQNKAYGTAIAETQDLDNLRKLSVTAVDKTNSYQLWQVEGDNNGYTLRNVATGSYAMYIDEIYKPWYVNDEANKFYIDIYTEATEATPDYYYISFRKIENISNEQYSVMHASGSDIVRWEQRADASQWNFVELTEAEISTIQSNVLTTLSSNINEAETLLANAGLSKVKLTVDMLSTNAPHEEGGGLASLVDNIVRDNNNFFHSNWGSNGSSIDGGDHYIQIDLGDNESISDFCFAYVTRKGASNDYPKTIKIYGSDNGTDFGAEPITTVTNLASGDGKYIVSPNIISEKSYRHIRLVVTETSTNRVGEGKEHNYFHMGEFYLYKITDETTKYNVAKVTALTEIANFLDTMSKDPKLAEASYYNRYLGESAFKAMLREYPFTLTTDVTNPVCYFIKSGRNANDNEHKYWTFVDNKIKIIDNPEYTKDIECYWYFMEDPNTGYVEIYPFIVPTAMGYTTVKNQGADRITNTGNVIDNDYSVVGPKVDDTYAKYPYAFLPKGGSNYVSHHGGGTNNLGLYSGLVDAGTRIDFEPAEITPASKLRDLRNTIKSLPAITAGTTIGSYSEDAATLRNNIAESSQAVYNDATTATNEICQEQIDAINNFVSNYRTMIVKPRPGTLYRLKNEASGNYLQSSLAENGRLNVTSDNFNTSVFYYDGKTIVSFKEGRSIDPGNRNLAYVGTMHEVSIEVPYNNTSNYAVIKANGCYIHGAGATADRGSGTPNNNGYNWTFEEVSWVPVGINTEIGWGTLYSPVAVNYTQYDRVKAYTAKVKDGYVDLQEIEGSIIPANTGVVLEYIKGAENGCVYLQQVNYEGAELDSDLIGEFATRKIDKEDNYEYYVLSAPTGRESVGLYVAANANNDVDSFINTGFKAYLKVKNPTGANGVAAYSFRFEGTTAVEEVETENADAVIYDLAGRRIEKITQAGIYIVNGNKVLVK